MLNQRTKNFSEIAWHAAASIGHSAPRIADAIIDKIFPETAAAARREGADKMLRNGVILAIKAVVKGSDDISQIDFSELSAEFGPIVKKLGSKSYYVETLQEYVSVRRLTEDAELLDDARKHIRRKGEECLAEADRLDELYLAVVGAT